MTGARTRPESPQSDPCRRAMGGAVSGGVGPEGDLASAFAVATLIGEAPALGAQKSSSCDPARVRRNTRFSAVGQ